jgi:hypothetical protein
MINKGKKEGDIEERKFVINFNKGKFREFQNKFFGNITNLYSVRVTSKQISKMNNLKVQPKSDAYLIELDPMDIQKIVDKDYLIVEEDLEKLKHKIVNNSGISIKRPDSTKYQIHKFTPNSFNMVFDNPYLGAGCLIYLDNSEMLSENTEIIKNWGIEIDQFNMYFSKNLGINIAAIENSYKMIQKYCLSEIKNQIQSNSRIKQLVFTGEGIFDSPYCARFSYISGQLDEFQYTDFIVTQGSNRQDNPTIVIKPRAN